jgi:integrase/recombinase XerD
MKNNTQAIANQVAGILREAGIETYDQTKNLFREIRKTMQITPPTTRKKSKTVKTITRDEVSRFLETCVGNDLTTGLMMETLYRSAVRSHELIKIQVVDFKPDKNYLLIDTNDGQYRQVTITAALADRLLDYLNGRNSGPLFVSNRGKAFSSRRIEQMVSQSADQAGLDKKVTPGTLRNSRISHLRKAGMAEEDLKDFIG